jgi:LPXTG-motif cell wall-anchored protein
VVFFNVRVDPAVLVGVILLLIAAWILLRRR